jgi:hypothetical protein
MKRIHHRVQGIVQGTKVPPPFGYVHPPEQIKIYNIKMAGHSKAIFHFILDQELSLRTSPTTEHSRKLQAKYAQKNRNAPMTADCITLRKSYTICGNMQNFAMTVNLNDARERCDLRNVHPHCPCKCDVHNIHNYCPPVVGTLVREEEHLCQETHQRISDFDDRLVLQSQRRFGEIRCAKQQPQSHTTEF